MTLQGAMQGDPAFAVIPTKIQRVGGELGGLGFRGLSGLRLRTLQVPEGNTREGEGRMCLRAKPHFLVG